MTAPTSRESKGLVLVSINAGLIGVLAFIFFLVASFASSVRQDELQHVIYLSLSAAGALAIVASRGIYRRRRWAALLWLALSAIPVFIPQFAALSSGRVVNKTVAICMAQFAVAIWCYSAIARCNDVSAFGPTLVKLRELVVPSVSITWFRVVVVVAIVAWTAAVVIAFTGDASSAQSSNLDNALLPYHVYQLLWVLYFELTIGGLVGLLFFWSPGRWILLSSLILSMLLQQTGGTAHYLYVQALCSSVFILSSCWLVTISLWSEFGRHFSSFK